MTVAHGYSDGDYLTAGSWNESHIPSGVSPGISASGILHDNAYEAGTTKAAGSAICGSTLVLAPPGSYELYAHQDYITGLAAYPWHRNWGEAWPNNTEFTILPGGATATNFLTVTNNGSTNKMFGITGSPGAGATIANNDDATDGSGATYLEISYSVASGTEREFVKWDMGSPGPTLNKIGFVADYIHVNDTISLKMQWSIDDSTWVDIASWTGGAGADKIASYNMPAGSKAQYIRFVGFPAAARTGSYNFHQVTAWE